jgi:lipoprotein-releasing system permease protein
MRSRLLLAPFPLPLILALRYLRSTRRDSFARFLSLVATAGIGLGVAALILALAMLSGFQRALLAQILVRTPQIEVALPAGSDPLAAERALVAVPGVEGVTRVARGRGWLAAGDRVQPVAITGFAGRLPPTFPGAAGGAPGLYLGDGLAARWGLERGERVDVVSPRPTLTPFGPQPRVRSLPVAGTFASARTEDRERVALPLAVAESLLGRPGLVLEVAAGGLEMSLKTAPRLAAALPAGSEVRTWRELNRPLLFALHLEKLLTFVAVSLVVGVASLALVSNLALLIASKQPEIGMLQACGATPAAIRRAFLCLGTLLAGIGVGLGAPVGVAAAIAFDRYRVITRLVELTTGGGLADVFFIDRVPFAVEARDVAAILGLALLLALSASLYAARRATALPPVEAMRR